MYSVGHPKNGERIISVVPLEIQDLQKRANYDDSDDFDYIDWGIESRFG